MIFLDIPVDDIYAGGAMEPTDYFSGVDVISREYVKGDESVEIFKGPFSKANNPIRFTEPLHSLVATGATITTAHVNYAVLNAPDGSEVLLTGRRYVVNETVLQLRDIVIAGETESIAAFDGCTLVNSENVDGIAKNVFDYLRYRLRTDGDIRLSDRTVGRIAKVHTYGYPIFGILEQLDIKLRSGRANMRVIGNVDRAGIR